MQPLQESPFDFNALEHFVKETSNGNITIFTHLMTTSGLAEHATAKFYWQLITRTLLKEVPATDDLAGIFGSGDSKIVDRGKLFAEELLHLEQDIFTQYLIQYQDQDIPKLKIIVKNTLIDYFKKTKTFSFLWPSIKEDVLFAIKTKLATK